MLFSCSNNKIAKLTTVNEVDLNKYQGKWYEIANYPTKFQKGCSCTTAEYKLTEKGYVEVINSCKRNGEATNIKGKAFIVKGSRNAKLKVQFFWPFKGNYWVIDLANDYSYAVVSEPRQKYLWILSRTPQMEETVYNEILNKLKEKGFELNKIVKTEHSCLK